MTVCMATSIISQIKGHARNHELHCKSKSFDLKCFSYEKIMSAELFYMCHFVIGFKDLPSSIMAFFKLVYTAVAGVFSFET